MRSKLLSLLVGAAVALSLAAALIPPQQAAAEPPPTVSVRPDAPGGPAPGVSLTPLQWKAAKLARDARNKAVSDTGKSMDYRKMKKVYGTKNKTQVDWRRQYAAGYRQMGGKIKHISKAENKAVEKRRKALYKNKKPRHSLSDGTIRTFENCRGRTGTVVNGDVTTQYLNSCEVVDIVWAWGICGTAMGAIGFFAGAHPRVSWPAFAVGAFCGYWAGLIGKEATKSSTGSVYIRTYKAQAYQPYPGQVRYYIRTTIHAQ